MIDKQKSIRVKLIKLILIISSLSLLVAFAVLLAYELIWYRQSTARQLGVVANMLSQNSTAALAFENLQEAEEILSSLRAEPHIVAAALYKADGKIFVQTLLVPGEHIPSTLTPKRQLRRQNGYFEVMVPVIQGQKTLGALFIKRSTQDVQETLGLYVMVVVSVLTVCFGLTYFLSRRFEKSISDPIIGLARTAKVVSEEHDYSVRADTTGYGEIRILTSAFNVMLSRIEDQNKQIQQHTLELETKVEERTLEIKRQKDFAETVVNSSLVLIAVFDRETRFMEFNNRCEIEFGLRREDVLGKRYSEVMPKVVGSPAYKAVIMALNGEVAHFAQYKSPVSENYYETFGIPLRNEKDEVYAALVTAHNTTAIVTATDKLIKSNEELRKKNVELEQFAYVASHDLQEPLRKIRMFADRAKQLLPGDNGSSKYLEKIDASSYRMSCLIRDVLEYSRLTKVEESFVDVDLNIILENVKTDFELLIAEKNALIESDTLPMVRGNQLQLHQLFANLINNSIKFCENRPEITIRALPVAEDETERVSNLDKTRTYCKLTFSDNGIGFEPQFRDKVFTIFQRLNTRSKYEGTGIGLALCKKIVENHNGHISVDSTPAHGTVFSIILPAS